MLYHRHFLYMILWSLCMYHDSTSKVWNIVYDRLLLLSSVLLCFLTIYNLYSHIFYRNYFMQYINNKYIKQVIFSGKSLCQWKKWKRVEKNNVVLIEQKNSKKFLILKYNIASQNSSAITMLIVLRIFILKTVNLIKFF